MEEKMIPVPAGLQKGAQTARWVFDQITTFPETHNQRDWVQGSGCGTKACVAGWAALAHGKEFLKQFTGDVCCAECSAEGIKPPVDWADAGRQALCLGSLEADELFRGRNSREGVLHALKDLANGQPVNVQHLRDTREPY